MAAPGPGRSQPRPRRPGPRSAQKELRRPYAPGTDDRLSAFSCASGRVRRIKRIGAVNEHHEKSHDSCAATRRHFLSDGAKWSRYRWPTAGPCSVGTARTWCQSGPQLWSRADGSGDWNYASDDAPHVHVDKEPSQAAENWPAAAEATAVRFFHS
jgi:hypothetical protein